MSENQTVVAETAQSQTVTTTPIVEDTALSRLSQEFPEEVKTIDPPTTDQSTTPVVEPTPEERLALTNKAKELGLPETATKAEVEAAQTAQIDATTWQLDEVVPTTEEQNDGTWKGLIAELELGDVPADYNEDNGFETVQNLYKAKLESEVSKAMEMNKYDRFADVPEEARGEAEMLVELMKSGLTLEKINEPFMNLAAYKALSKEEQVRDSLMNRFKGDVEVVDLKMEKIIEDGHLDTEHRAIQLELNEYEERLKQGRQAQIETFKTSQNRIQEQKFNQESAKLKHALGGVQEYLGKKLTPEVKSVLENELTSGKYHSMDGTPEEKIDFLLYKRFGKAGIASFQARALEKVVLENKQTQHNVPIVTNGNVNRVNTSGRALTEAEQRLVAEFGNGS
tara:strand:- start:312 stop:1499 length:1188 start_codon:yes stop_codon:yes gene_type:complete